MTMKAQAAHPNPVKGTSIEEQDHPSSSRFIAGLFELAGSGPKLDWVNCGLCVDERGAGDWIEGPRRGGPGDLFKMSQASTNTLIIGTR